MKQALRQNVVVQAGGVIEIHSSELPAGARAEVIVILEERTKNKSSLSRMIGTGKGLFYTPEEADNFIRRERQN